jgi:pilus assembly protein Flp/PilA
MQIPMMMPRTLVLRLRDDRGQTLAEYALILALIAILCIGALTALQGGISGLLGTVTAKL